MLVPNPTYPIHPYGFVIAGADIRHVPMLPGLDFFEDSKTPSATAGRGRSSCSSISRATRPRPAWISISSSAWCAFAREHEIWVIHDLAYAEIAFDGYQAPSILQVPGAKDIAVEAYTLSKTYNMPGWRVGFMCGNPTLVGALARIKSYLDYGTFTPIQVAAIAALEGPQDCVREIAAMYQSRRDVLCEGLNTGRLGGGEAQGDHVRVGAHPGALPGAGFARIQQAAAHRGAGGGVARHRLWRIRGRVRALRLDRKRTPHAPGGPRGISSVLQGGKSGERMNASASACWVLVPSAAARWSC
ncbi:MAG: aminotransferase class I/II-fold pyridoxal phosphate-dependent enzyme [Candidatus Manganitrophus sp.]|nr:MAG: aminotransferase class I/II-fold pyridoxal phosphate-dependent enzyme [Candidatus Manganitrophus sp.]